MYVQETNKMKTLMPWVLFSMSVNIFDFYIFILEIAVQLFLFINRFLKMVATYQYIDGKKNN